MHDCCKRVRQVRRRTWRTYGPGELTSFYDYESNLVLCTGNLQQVVGYARKAWRVRMTVRFCFSHVPYNHIASVLQYSVRFSIANRSSTSRSSLSIGPVIFLFVPIARRPFICDHGDRANVVTCAIVCSRLDYRNCKLSGM